jgi:hypothetical protein
VWSVSRERGGVSTPCRKSQCKMCIKAHIGIVVAVVVLGVCSAVPCLTRLCAALLVACRGGGEGERISPAERQHDKV